MRMLVGSKVVEAQGDWRASQERDGHPVVIDVGAGDGRYVYEKARNDPASFYVGVDPDADTLREYAFRASRKPARGGVANVAFVVAALEALPEELKGLADQVRVNFPWGSLMRALLEPDARSLQQLAALLKPGGRIEIVTSYEPEHDTQAFAGPRLPPLTAGDIETRLGPAYETAGFPIVEYRRLTLDEALELPSTWGRRLLHARPRDVYYIACVPRAAR